MKLRNLLIGVGITLGSIFLPKVADAQVTGNLKYVHSADGIERSYPEIYTFYKLPKEINGFSFMYFYNSGQGYFGKTILNKKIAGRIGIKSESIHINEPITQEGLGLTASVPYLPENASLSVDFLPFWFDKNGRIPSRSSVGYFGSVNLPANFQFSSFGKWVFGNGKGPKWGYGEAELTAKLGPFRVGYNPALIGDGDAIPRVEHRALVGIDF